jgi:uncharacterized protein YcbK (DUF882 family)
MRRHTLVLSCLFLANSASAAPRQARSTRPVGPHAHRTAPRDRYPAVPIYAAQVGESLGYRPFDQRGRDRREAARALERLLRSGQTGARHRLDPRLGAALYAIGRHYAGHRIEIFSGYRPRAYCDRAHSRHITGSAVDFRVDGVENEALIAYLKTCFHPAGVGYYPNDPHVHLDLDRRVDTYWTEARPPAGDPTLEEQPLPAPPPEADLDDDAAPAGVGDPPMDDPSIGIESATVGAADEDGTS